jgi:hypothetical protein
LIGRIFIRTHPYRVFQPIVGALSMLIVLAGGSWLGMGVPGLWIAYVADE